MIADRTYLTNRLQYDSATGVFVWRDGKRNGKVAGCTFSNGYRYIHIFGRMIGVHRLAWLYVHGILPDQIDHKNGNPGDNWIDNLRPSTQSQNKQNARVRFDSKSKRKGVVWSKDHKKWRAYIGPRGLVKYLGYYDDPDVAYQAYCAAAKETYGEFSRI